MDESRPLTCLLSRLPVCRQNRLSIFTEKNQSCASPELLILNAIKPLFQYSESNIIALLLSLSLSLPSLSVFLPSFLSLSLPESFMGNAGISTKKPKSLKQTTEIRYEEIETIGFYWKPGPGAAKRAPMKQRRSTVKL